MSDEFFDDEQELMAEETPAAPAPKPSRKSAKATATSTSDVEGVPHRDAPPFWMVLAIAAIALILGIVIGYLIGTSATLSQLGNSSASTAQQVTEDTQSATGQLPEGHPDLNINEDGTATLAENGSDSGSSAE